jgi:5'-nucleotidase
MHGSRKVGIFALTLHAEDGGNDRAYAPVDEDYLGAAKEALSRLERENVDLVVGLTHLHIETDREIAKLKEEHPQFLFILGGHEHEPEYEPGTASSAAIMKGASNARVIWQVGVRFDTADGAIEVVPERIVVDESIEQDKAYVGISDRWRARLLELYPFLESTVSYAALPMDAREVTVRNEESAWANFIVDQMRTAFGPPSDLAFINSGTLRLDDWVAEDITFEDIARTFGFSSYLRYMTVRGEDFRALMEAGYRGTGPSKGYFPQVSGFRVCIDRDRPEGERIVQMLVAAEDSWAPIEPEADYLLVAPDFLYGGGDGYDFAEARDVSRPGSELKYQVLDGIIRAQAEGRKVGEPVDPEAPRIAFLTPGQQRCF